MKKLIRHEWKVIPSHFKHWKCIHCTAKKEWDVVFQRIVYYDRFGNGPLFRTPECVLPNTKL